MGKKRSFDWLLQVTLKSRELRDNYVTSYLQLKRMEDNLVRDITHLWYTLWPVAGVPQDVKTVVAILLEARKGQSKDQQGPIVVHCRYFQIIRFSCLRHFERNAFIHRLKPKITPTAF